LLAADQRPIFARLVKRSFSQRRKMMMKLLKGDWSAETLERAFKSISVPLDARAETLSLEQFVGLTQALAK
jgi:16S rRNA A1518/A1519 N6-dimethyltransferase RsmA/KsgA/DIM1 with predicted DNA glycosylase/AP lyase activity